MVHQDDADNSLLNQNQPHHSSNTDNSENVSFTPAQYQQILQLLGKEKQDDQLSYALQNNNKSAYAAGNFYLLASTGSKWILDSGATDHMCFDLNMLLKLLYFKAVQMLLQFQMKNKLLSQEVEQSSLTMILY